MTGSETPRTRLEQILQQRHMTLGEFRKHYNRASGTELSERQAYRWVAGQIQGMPYPHAQATLENIFGEPASRLLNGPSGMGQLKPRQNRSVENHDPAVSAQDWQGQVIEMSTNRARHFLNRAEETNMGGETLDQLTDDLRRLSIAYQQKPLEYILSDLVTMQDRVFGLLEGRQQPRHTRDLYLLAGVASGLMAKASHDLGSAHDAMTQARTAYACADNADHDGLRAWTRGMQSLISYWDGRPSESVRYAQEGARVARGRPTSATVWLASAEARSLAALGRTVDAHKAVDHAVDLREQVYDDELDELGGLFTFPRARQLYYAADALAWAGAPEAEHTERIAREALDAYERAPGVDRAFGDEAGTHCALAVARIVRGDLEGAAEAVEPVLELPPPQRIHGIVRSSDQVRVALTSTAPQGRRATELNDALHAFSSDRLALPG